MPVGFCCENCDLYDEFTTCLKSKPTIDKESETTKLEEIKLINSKIEGNLLKVVIEHQDEKKRTLIIDLTKYLEIS
jgi:hypothetical protein